MGAEGESKGGVSGGEGAADAEMLFASGFLKSDVDQLPVLRVRADSEWVCSEDFGCGKR